MYCLEMLQQTRTELSTLSSPLLYGRSVQTGCLAGAPREHKTTNDYKYCWGNWSLIHIAKTVMRFSPDPYIKNAF